MSAHDNFWNWFLRHEEGFFRLDTTDVHEREPLFEALASELRKIDRNLCFEFGPKSSKREFVISADGIKRAFPAVTSLVAAAPHLERWILVGFRPRRPLPLHIQYGGLRVDSKDVTFSLFEHGDKIGLRMFIRGYRSEDEAFKVIACLLLDVALGEYDVETWVGPIDIGKADGNADGAPPLTQLPEQFDELLAKLRGRPRPS